MDQPGARSCAAARRGINKMTFKEACRVLGVPLGPTLLQIKAARLEKIKRYHPDLNSEPDAVLAFQRVCEAVRTLREKPPVPIPCLHLAPPDRAAIEAAINDAEGNDAVVVVRMVMMRNDLVILSDGTMRVGLKPQRGYGPDDEEAWLARPADWNGERLLDAVMDEVRDKGLGIPTAVVKRAVRWVIREGRRARENSVMRPLLYDRLDAAELARAAAMWARLVSATLDIDPALGVAVLQHFIWQVKRKQLGLSVCHHLMPVIVSPVQGSGKTTFVVRLLGPLEELASAPVLLSDLADPRSGEILSFPVVFVDDVERLDPRQNAGLKSLVTAPAVSRRQLGTSKANKLTQRATLIGTANEQIRVLIADPTGHRRFVELPFRNGAVAKGGNVEVWRAVDETDHSLLWRSVNPFDLSPILPHLDSLAAAQAASAPIDRLRECLVGLDQRSEDLQNITVRGGVGADGLRLLVCKLLREEIKANAFSARMAVLVHDPAVPFGPKGPRTSQGYVYPFKHLG